MNRYHVPKYMTFQESNFTKKVIFSDANTLVFVLNFLPGQTLPMHQHMSSTVSIYCLSGNGMVKVNEEEKEMSQGYILLVQGNDHFGIPLVKESLSLLVTVSPNPSNPAYSKSID